MFILFVCHVEISETMTLAPIVLFVPFETPQRIVVHQGGLVVLLNIELVKKLKSTKSKLDIQGKFG